MVSCRVILFLSVLTLLFSCKNGPREERSLTPRTFARPEPRLLSMTEPSSRETITSGKEFYFNLAWRDSVGKTDSVEIFFDAVKIRVLKDGELSARISTENVFPGTRVLRAVAHFPDRQREVHTSEIIVLSEIIPQRYTYRIINVYPHDIGAFTQGFEYHNGFFYEGTGQYGESSLRKVEIETGQVLKARTLPANLFGEGITIINDRIYQVTYRSQVGFVYKLDTFEEIQRIYYQNKEGWGLTNNGREVIMSDGTHQVYFMDPRYFTVNRKIEVMDNNGKVEQVNELEWIDGKIWANIYLTDDIIIFDPESGRVEGRIDLTGILPPGDRHPRVDVLNGIAWDEKNSRLFVTGKYWPKVFEIQIVKI